MSAIANPYITEFACGCVWNDKRHAFSKDCGKHLPRPLRNYGSTVERCTCLNAGNDDGAVTCWQHHNCQDGSCTHAE